MRNFVKAVAYQLLGKELAQAIARGVRNERRVFSEVRLAFDYFRETGKAGTLIDVGAHTGESFAPFLRLGWRVVAFEPDPENRRVIAEKGLDRGITLLPHAVSDRKRMTCHFTPAASLAGYQASPPSGRRTGRLRGSR